MPNEDCYKAIGELSAEIENLKEWRREYEHREGARILADAKKEAAVLKAESFRDGAVWALAKVGAAVVGALSVVGWVTIHGLPDWLKSVLR